MHRSRIRPLLLLSALCALVSGCAGLAPGWGAAAPGRSAPTAMSTAPAVASREDACHAEAWQHRLDVPGDQGLAYGQAYRDCMQRLAAGDGRSAPAATPSEAARTSRQRGTLPAKAARN